MNDKSIKCANARLIDVGDPTPRFAELSWM